MVFLARTYASLTLLVLAGTAATLATRRRASEEKLERSVGTLCAFAVLGALMLPGFLYNSQVAMLEAPLSLALACGLWSTAAMLENGLNVDSRFPWGAVVSFTAAFTAGFWIKGPPILVLFGVLLVGVAFRWIRFWHALVAMIGALGLTGMSVWLFDTARADSGLGPFFSTYLKKQVLQSITVGRHNPDSDPLFYLRPLWRWYAPAVVTLLAFPLGLRLVSKNAAARARWHPEVTVLGAALWLGIVVGFSVPVQKYQWYIHPGFVGAALVVGSALAVVVPERVHRWSAMLCTMLSLTWVLVAQIPWQSRLTTTQRHLWALQSSSGPLAGDAIADCSPMDGWVSGHLMGFLWKAHRVECEAPAQWRFDGSVLKASSY
jgi:hypothetical protein